MEFKQKTFFGRRKGKGMSKAKENLITSFMPKFQITLPKNNSKIDLFELFDFKPSSFVFEIGYGDGDHLINMAIKNPDIAFIGTEVFMNGNASILKKILDNDIKNIRIFPDDVNLLFPFLKNESFDRLFILYPDPWPKNRNQDRRMVNLENLKIFSRILKKNAEMLVVSDHPIYIPWVLFCMQNQKDFIWNVSKSADFVNVPLDWETTKYEQKALKEGRIPIYLSFIKK